MVNYLNSKPFAYGIEKCGSAYHFESVPAHPADCAALFRSGEVDIALVPVGALDDVEGRIITDFCIGCDGEVRTVCLFSDIPIENCSKIWLDNHSRTSNLLSRLIMEQYFGKRPEYEVIPVEDFKPGIGEAVLMIGDKVFNAENRFKYKYDLGQIWKNWTGLPFVFAVWVARASVTEDVAKALNDCLRFGIENISTVIDQVNSESLDLLSYFRQNIRYHLDDAHKEALALFRTKCESLKLQKNPL